MSEFKDIKKLLFTLSEDLKVKEEPMLLLLHQYVKKRIMESMQKTDRQKITQASENKHFKLSALLLMMAFHSRYDTSCIVEHTRNYFGFKFHIF